jgi:hypothetical protein
MLSEATFGVVDYMARSAPARGSFDLSWFTGTMVAPRTLARRLTTYLPNSGEAVAVTELAHRSGRSAREIAEVLPFLVGDGLVLIDDDGEHAEDPLLRLNPQKQTDRDG